MRKRRRKKTRRNQMKRRRSKNWRFVASGGWGVYKKQMVDLEFGCVRGLGWFYQNIFVLPDYGRIGKNVENT